MSLEEFWVLYKQSALSDHTLVFYLSVICFKLTLLEQNDATRRMCNKRRLCFPAFKFQSANFWRKNNAIRLVQLIWLKYFLFSSITAFKICFIFKSKYQEKKSSGPV
jgi:hypothetical protein